MATDTYMIIGLAVFLLFVLALQYFFPMFQKSSLRHENPSQRSRALIIDPKFGQGEILERRDLGDDRVKLTVRVGREIFMPTYYLKEIVPVSMKQVLSDSQPPIFAVKSAPFINQGENFPVKDKNQEELWLQRYELLKGDVYKNVQRHLDAVSQLERARKDEHGGGE